MLPHALLLQWEQDAHCDKFRYICAIQWHKEDSAPLPLLCKYTIRSLSAIMKLSSALQHSRLPEIVVKLVTWCMISLRPL